VVNSTNSSFFIVPHVNTVQFFVDIPIRAFKLSNASSPYFPDSVLVDQNTIDQYFGREAKVAIPVLFLLNTINMHVYPVSRGNLTFAELTDRMNSLMQRIRQFEGI
jgi:hypothetical protein